MALPTIPSAVALLAGKERPASEWFKWWKAVADAIPAAGVQPLNTYLTTLAGLGKTCVGVQLLTASGDYTPTTGAVSGFGILQAAGGGGGGCNNSAGTGRGGCGGAGETRAFQFDISGVMAAVLGAAGSGGNAGNNAGGTASDSTFAGITCKGGTGGGGSTGATNGTPGTTPTGSGGILIPPTLGASSNGVRMNGGCSLLGIGPIDIQATPHVGQAAGGYGAGGGGAYDTGTTARAGGDGSGPCLLILEFP